MRPRTSTIGSPMEESASVATEGDGGTESPPTPVRLSMRVLQMHMYVYRAVDPLARCPQTVLSCRRAEVVMVRDCAAGDRCANTQEADLGSSGPLMAFAPRALEQTQSESEGKEHTRVRHKALRRIVGFGTTRTVHASFCYLDLSSTRPRPEPARQALRAHSSHPALTSHSPRALSGSPSRSRPHAWSRGLHMS